MYTHIGKRHQNQDKVLVKDSLNSGNGKAKLFAVADGMGGHKGGCQASQMACDRLSHYFTKHIRGGLINRPHEISRHLTEAIMRIDREIRLKGKKGCELEDMGTTLSCLVITESHSIIAHVGDTRIYRMRRGHFTSLTVNHTFVQDMIFEGEVDPDEAHLHPLRNVLTRAVGTGEPLSLVDCRIDPLKIKDQFVLCSDGLYNAPNDEFIQSGLSSKEAASNIAKKLVFKALHRGAKDNISAIVVKIDKPISN
jgi:serine/threonine protein phosphatase PrpC